MNKPPWLDLLLSETLLQHLVNTKILATKIVT